jgi:hypothetical protein
MVSVGRAGPGRQRRLRDDEGGRLCPLPAVRLVGAGLALGAGAELEGLAARRCASRWRAFSRASRSVVRW